MEDTELDPDLLWEEIKETFPVEGHKLVWTIGTNDAEIRVGENSGFYEAIRDMKAMARKNGKVELKLEYMRDD